MASEAQKAANRRHKERLEAYDIIEVKLAIPRDDLERFKKLAERARKRVGYIPLPAGRGGSGEE